MRTDTPQTIYRKDYTPPSYLVDTVELGFDLDPARTIVANRMTMRRNPDSAQREIELYGENLELVALRMNGNTLGEEDYRIEGHQLTIPDTPEEVTLEIETICVPEQNTTLNGLYTSNGSFYTQCEAEGFRAITYFPDRPDVMAVFTVMLRADKEKYPVLLSNGNLVEEGELGDGRHYAKWEDPFKKPSYLFALVAARLVCQEETFRLKDGRDALLQVWVEDGNLDKTDYAMQALKNGIRWDEERWDLELDLDRFMIVAVGDFNMGAMENKGLNIFNTKFVLANPRVATDIDFQGIEAVVGHEYFHNWTGNRVTCRDWFQLSLKEGLTVFRDQEFSADMIGTDSGRAVGRIDQVRTLRQTQFPEDAGPMAHPVRPDSFVEINNFYTVTVYEKGAEVVRMYQTLLGRDGFKKGMDLYFERHDGQAVTCDDFLCAMADANGRDLTRFERWYSQSGTPVVRAETRYDEIEKTYTLTFFQSCPPTPGQASKFPFHIPIAVGLLDADGNDIALTIDGAEQGTTAVLELTEFEQSFVFENVLAQPTPSILRNFSAPVILDFNYGDADLLHLFSHDSDAVNRWEAGQRLAMGRLLKLTGEAGVGAPLLLDDTFLVALGKMLLDESLDPAFREQALLLPSEGMVAEQIEVVNPMSIHLARQFMRANIGAYLRTELLAQYRANQTPGEYSPDALSAGKRALKNLCLAYLAAARDEEGLALAQQQFDAADNMTDRIAALAALVDARAPGAEAALQRFYDEFEDEPLVVDKWFAMQAANPLTDVPTVRGLMRHQAFNLRNPNRARSVISSFCTANPVQFHAPDGSGYAFWAEQVITLDALNPQVASRLARSMDRWRRYTPELQEQMKKALQQVAGQQRLSNNVREVIGKALAN
ncbi:MULTISPECIES: aminopeptidase N [unclassified Massilia]|uniref:aminopeptidase N n=1 Tax=unclassified Massilia TaxID=2609279 RepID=UPI0017875CCC|nr:MULTISPECIES: aminopeptidase N [unclassified Massilia]MBD8529854.1 aminopeptidase N [Massilia sp. CFBP 13647]MBD8672134.1 aminopeptidase N [Massilia sp. CFBP 13721]